MTSWQNPRNPGKLGATVLLVGLALLFAYPFAWMAMASFKSNDTIFQAWPLWPERFQIKAYHDLLSGEIIPFLRQFTNTILIAGLQTVLALALCSTSAYVLARHQFRARLLVLFGAVLVILIPRQALVLPLFIWMNDLHLLDTLWSVVLPGAVSGIGVLFFLQAWKRLPNELFQLARAEGASETRIFFTTLPLIKPTLFAYGLIHFVFAWQEHLIPLVMLNSTEKLTLGISLATLNSSSLHTPYSFLMAASTMAVFPAFLVFALLFKHLRSALAELTVQ
jgi:ABC-type glycerol-3-phosphate transport system permease component